MNLSIGVTGHRDLLDDEKPHLEERVRAFFIDLKQRYPRLRLQLLCPMAEGGDQLVARVALSLDIELVVVLPLPLHDYENDFESPESLAEFRTLLESADQIISLPGAPGPESRKLASDVTLRDRQYAQAGLFISNHCQILLCLWDGKSSQAVGGTAQVLRYHLTAVMEGFEDQQSSAHLLADNENDLAYHIVCSRNRPNGAPEPGFKPLECYWLTSQLGRTSGDEMPGEYALMLDRLQQFEIDRSQHASHHVAGQVLLTNRPDGLEVPDSALFTERLFGIADSLAVHYQKRVNLSLYAIYTMAVLMGLVFIVYTEYSVPQTWLWAFLGLFFAGVALHATGSKRQWHRKYLDYRALAEALRVQFYWNLAGVVETQSVAFAYENFLQKQDVELGWIRHVMRTASTQRARGKEPDPAWVPWVIQTWVGDSKSGGGQLAYYTRKEVHNSERFRRTEFLGAVCLWSGISVTVVLALATEALNNQYQQILLVLMGILPLIAGVRDAISHRRAEKELIKQYRFMARIFSNARHLLDENTSVAFQRRVLKALGEASLEEGAEWILMHRSRPLEHQGLA